MRFTSAVFATSILASTVTAWFFPLTPAPVFIPLKPPAPVASTCQAAVSYKPLGSFLFGSLFPNPWAGLGGSLTIPNCNVAPAPVCPSGQSCLSTANPCAAGQVCLSSSNPCAAGQTCLSTSNPCTVSGQSCLTPPPAHWFPAAQAAGNLMCNSASPGLIACLDPSGTAARCCAP